VYTAASGTRPVKSVARSVPIRCTPMYQHTKPTTVTTAACHSSAAVSGLAQAAALLGSVLHARGVREGVRLMAEALGM
jgi:hypothetical protein